MRFTLTAREKTSMLGLLKQRERLAMLAACIAVFLTALDQTVVVTALPQITADLNIDALHLDRAAWIVSGYLLGYVVAMPLMGRISDLYGRRRVFLICLAIFASGSLFCGLAPALGNTFDVSFLNILGIDTSSHGLVWLVAARFIQAAGGGAIVPVAMAIAGDFYGPERRATALGLIGMVAEAGGVLGPLYGAVIVQQWSWPYIFYLNLPIVALLLIPILLYIPTESRVTEGEKNKERIDIPGALLLGASLTCMSLGLSQEAALLTPGQGDNAAPQNNLWLVLAAVVLFVAFLTLEFYRQRRANWPLIEPALFKRLHFSAAALSSFLSGAALIIAMVDIPLFIATTTDATAIDSGLALLRLTALIPVGAILGGWLSRLIGSRWTAVGGLLLSALGFWLMSRWSLGVGWAEITVSAVIGGLGFGLIIAPISTSALNVVSSQQGGQASSIITMLRMVGMILGLAALTSWGLGRFRALAAAFVPPPGVKPMTLEYFKAQADYLVTVVHGVYTTIFLAAGILCLLALLPALGLQGRQPGSAIIRNTEESTPSGQDPVEDPETPPHSLTEAGSPDA
jgi:MFS family permease